MRRCAVHLIGLTTSAISAHADVSYRLSNSTYLGGSNWEHARDVATDASGFTYVVGGTASSNFTGAASFPGSNIYNAGQPNTAGDGAFGSADVFVTKLDLAGQVVWTKYLGGKNYDRAYAVEVDATSGDVYISGRAGIGYPTTSGLQTSFQGTTGTAAYGSQNAFVTKMNSSGQVQWSTYLGTGELARDLAFDGHGGVYVPMTLASTSSRTLDANYFSAGKVKNAPPTSNTNDVGVAKLDAATGQLNWARWIGGSGSETTNPSIRVNAAGEPYLLFDTNSTSATLAAVGSVSQSNLAGGNDSYLAKFKSDGSGLVYGTYLGGSANEGHETHSLALDGNGNAVVAIFTTSANFPVTPGALNQGLGNNIGITKFDAAGARVISAIVGGSGNESPDGVYVDSTGRVILSGETNGTDLPVTPNAFQQTSGGSNDGFMMALSPDLSRIEYATYFGGTLYDNGRTLYLGSDGAVYLAGGTMSTNFPTLNAADSSFNGGSNSHAPGSGDAWLAKFILGPATGAIADANGDGLVDSIDYSTLASNYGTTSGATYAMGDFNYDGKVSTLDFNILAQHFGSAPGSIGAAVPEPAMMSIVVAGCFMVNRRRSARVHPGDPIRH